MSRARIERAIVRLAARAKINLRLQILAREETGYHQIETVFCALDFADDVEITLGGNRLQLDIECADGIRVPTGSHNLVQRAAELFFAQANKPPGATLRLKKRIPVGAGLGGGSSDAASTLKGLNLLTHNPLSDAQLTELGAQLGADVPFFLCGSSLALGWGRGQRLLPLSPLPPMPTLLVVPPFAIETRAAYQAIESLALAAPHVIKPIRLEGWDSAQQDARNDFENVLFPRYPELPEIRDALKEAGATTALLAGSGSALFGLFPLRRLAARAAKNLREIRPDLRTIETVTTAWTSY
ncbi:MAG: 4-(cytidine 5'-diphospho)-2-C-methyl-D-erythritol kinase [Longimicrobiales bacterium]